MTLRQRAPMPVKQLGRRVSVSWGTATAGSRMMPSFIMVGAQRCGTTSLYRALLAHPSILPPVYHKGVNYFDVGYGHGPAWYRGHFPRLSTAAAIERKTGTPTVTFEASGYYMHHPWAASRIAADLPDVKVVVMVRDPVERAFSAHKHELARGFESEPFEKALELEDSRIEPELARMVEDPSYQSSIYRHQAYRRRGHYAEQISAFVDRLGTNQVHVVDSNDFFAEPVHEYTRLLRFLEMPVVLPASFERYNARPSSAMPPGVEVSLREYFASHDRALEPLTGRTPSWRR